MRRTCVFSGSSHPSLTDSITERLGRLTDKVELRKFANGETSVEIKTSVRDQDVFIVQSGSNKTNDNVMELLIMIAACRGGSAKSVTAVMPYFPYSRQSKKKSHRGAITARMVANLMYVAGVNHVITIDLHASQMQGFFKCPVDNLVAEPILARWIRSHVRDWQDAVVVSKNPGGTKRVTSLADALKISFGIVTTDRKRPSVMPHSMYNSVVFESITGESLPPPIMQGPDPAEESEPRVSTADNIDAAAPIEHDFAPQSGDNKPSPDSRADALPRRPGKHRASTTVPPSLAHRLLNGAAISPSPLAQSSRPDSSDGPKDDSALEDKNDELDDAAESKVPPKMLTRMATAIGTMQPPPIPGSEQEDEEDGEYTDERARNVITGRLIHGHIVDDDYPSPVMSAMSGSTPGLYARPSVSDDEDPPDNMIQSFVSTASSHRPENGYALGGTGDATASDDDEEDVLKDPEGESTVTLVGNVRNRPVFLVDDIIDKPGSWIAAAETVVKRGGATKVYCMATHGLFGEDSLRQMDECNEIDAIVVTNTFPIPEEKRRGIRKLVVLDVSHLLSEAIRRNHHGESISQLFTHFDD